MPGIDVTQHSKDNRGFRIVYNPPTKTPRRSSNSVFRRNRFNTEDDDLDNNYGEDAFRQGQRGGGTFTLIFPDENP